MWRFREPERRELYLFLYERPNLYSLCCSFQTFNCFYHHGQMRKQHTCHSLLASRMLVPGTVGWRWDKWNFFSVGLHLPPHERNETSEPAGWTRLERWDSHESQWLTCRLAILRERLITFSGLVWL